jgi:queuine tRNA-ribosyltransferase
MQWAGPMLTDSGGFQIFSLSKNSKICKIDEKGASFKHPDTGVMIRMTPESSMETQRIIGADIIMAFDQCTANENDRALVMAAMERTHRWLAECKEYHAHHSQSAYGYDQALFGIIQGGMFRDLREQSAEFVVSQALDGIAFGGETIGFDMEKTTQILDWLLPMIPANKTRYTMGVGLHPQNLIDAVAHGADIFDCVAPTRNARHGSLYCGIIVKENGWVRYAPSDVGDRLLIKKKVFEKDERPITPGCECHTCQHYTRAYLHYLFKNNAWLYHQLACIHNVTVMQAVCRAMREVIAAPFVV